MWYNTEYMTKLIRKDTREAITAQALGEMAFARRYKQGKVANWQKNEALYYGDKKKTDDARANVDLGQMQEHVHTLLSKIDNPLTFIFTKRKESQRSRVERLNSLKDYDADRDAWDIKDVAGKKQSIMYGRAIFSYAASSDQGYKPQLENVDVYDFLIDPSAGGIDIGKARFMGRYGVVKDRIEIKDNPDYIKDSVRVLLSGKGNNTTRNQEDVNKQNRIFANKHTSGQKEYASDDKFKLWEWYTTYEGKRYYLLLSEDGAIALRVVPLTDLFANNEWPFWTYAASPDLTEFWTPSPCDFVRELIMAQATSINQMLDNAERVNKPQRLVDVSAITDLSQLKYRRDGHIQVSPGTTNAALRIVETPSIDTPLEVFRTLENIKQTASGVTAGALGVADTDGRATIYEGNQANVADRFGLFNKSYSFGYRRFGHLYVAGVDEHLTKKVAVDLIGPNGIETEMIGRSDIFRKNEDFGVIVESDNAELALSEQKRRGLGAFYSALLGRTELANQNIVIQELGEVAGVKPEKMRELLQLDMNGTARVISEAERDIEALMDGKQVRPNKVANAAYKQRFVDFMMDNEEHMSPEQFRLIVAYIEGLDDIIISNTVRAARDQASREMESQMAGGGPRPQMRSPGPSQPLQDVIQQNV